MRHGRAIGRKLRQRFERQAKRNGTTARRQAERELERLLGEQVT
ncbi:hypothetical protein [Bradyrhizobium sp. McL0616]